MYEETLHHMPKTSHTSLAMPVLCVCVCTLVRAGGVVDNVTMDWGCGVVEAGLLLIEAARNKRQPKSD